MSVSEIPSLTKLLNTNEEHGNINMITEHRCPKQEEVSSVESKESWFWF